MNADVVTQVAASDARCAAGIPLGAPRGRPHVIRSARLAGYNSFHFGWAPTSAAAGGALT
jgi:hypothetical protein